MQINNIEIDPAVFMRLHASIGVGVAPLAEAVAQASISYTTPCNRENNRELYASFDTVTGLHLTAEDATRLMEVRSRCAACIMKSTCLMGGLLEEDPIRMWRTVRGGLLPGERHQAKKALNHAYRQSLLPGVIRSEVSL